MDSDDIARRRKLKCPWCGWEYTAEADQVPTHAYPPGTRFICWGSGREPRLASDDRPLGKDEHGAACAGQDDETRPVEPGQPTAGDAAEER